MGAPTAPRPSPVGRPALAAAIFAPYRPCNALLAPLGLGHFAGTGTGYLVAAAAFKARTLFATPRTLFAESLDYVELRWLLFSAARFSYKALMGP